MRARDVVEILGFVVVFLGIQFFVDVGFPFFSQQSSSSKSNHSWKVRNPNFLHQNPNFGSSSSF